MSLSDLSRLYNEDLPDENAPVAEDPEVCDSLTCS